jgi:hypothetical protein
VAIQCLESAYGFETNDEEARAEYSIAPSTLLEVFVKGQSQLAVSAAVSMETGILSGPVGPKTASLFAKQIILVKYLPAQNCNDMTAR